MAEQGMAAAHDAPDGSLLVRTERHRPVYVGEVEVRTGTAP
jgi:hypothetical protein